MIEKYYLILNPVLAFLVYEDAKGRQIEGKIGGYSTILWVLWVLILGVFGLIPYLMARRHPGHEIRF